MFLGILAGRVRDDQVEIEPRPITALLEELQQGSLRCLGEPILLRPQSLPVPGAKAGATCTLSRSPDYRTVNVITYDSPEQALSDIDRLSSIANAPAPAGYDGGISVLIGPLWTIFVVSGTDDSDALAEDVREVLGGKIPHTAPPAPTPDVSLTDSPETSPPVELSSTPGTSPPRSQTPSTPSPEPSTPPTPSSSKLIPVPTSKTPQIAFDHRDDGYSKILITDLGGDSERALIEGFCPSWSPDGSTIAFHGSGGMGLLRAQDGRVTYIAEPGAGAGCPAWSPDGSRIAFTVFEQVGDNEGGNFYIDAVNPAGGGSMRLADGRSPSWSPDGSKLAYIDYDANYYPNLFVLDIPSGRVVQITEDGADMPAWSPDGSGIAFVRFERRETRILVTPPGGGPETELTSGPFDAYPAWSPDGGSLLYVHGSNCSIVEGISCRFEEIYAMRLSDQQLVKVAEGSHPAWRPS